METERISRIENKQPWVTDVIYLLDLHSKGDAWATGKLQEIVITAGSDLSNFYHRQWIKFMTVNGFEPAFKLAERYVDHREPWGDYYNEYYRIGFCCPDVELEEVKQELRKCPISKYEERYFNSYYDTKTKELRQNDDERVKKLNIIADKINKNFEIMSSEERLEFGKEIQLIIYEKVY